MLGFIFSPQDIRFRSVLFPKFMNGKVNNLTYIHRVSQLSVYFLKTECRLEKPNISSFFLFFFMHETTKIQVTMDRVVREQKYIITNTSKFFNMRIFLTGSFVFSRASAE